MACDWSYIKYATRTCYIIVSAMNFMKRIASKWQTVSEHVGQALYHRDALGYKHSNIVNRKFQDPPPPSLSFARPMEMSRTLK